MALGMLLCFFFKQKTAYEVRISDWSSDVCSSDLRARRRIRAARIRRTAPQVGIGARGQFDELSRFRTMEGPLPAGSGRYGMALSPDRKSVVQGKRVSVRVDRGGRRICKKTTVKGEKSHISQRATNTRQSEA